MRQIINIGLVYLLTLFLFYTIKKEYIRLLLALLIYLFGIFIFEHDYKLAIIYLGVAVCCVITESIFITFFDETWNYRKPDIINIPYWLIPIWAIAIILIIEINKNINSFILNLK